MALIAGMLATMLLPAAPAPAAPRADADNFEANFSAGDEVGTMLHADVLRPKGMPLTEKTPVILTVSPYTNHSGQRPTDFAPTATGPSERFYDFLNLSGALKTDRPNGPYTYVMVDLPGTGGSGGCNDWGGLREQGAVKAAVEWAASQSWSTGKVALIGKSYDGWTGLMGIAQQPVGLAAVIALEPVYSGYRYIFNNGVRFQNTAGTIATFQAGDAKPGTTNDTPQYHAGGAPLGYCYGPNVALSSGDESEAGPYWRERDLLVSTRGEETPLFLTQGFLETNTKQDAAYDFWNGLDLTYSRAWFNQMDHCRAWETGAACTYGGGGSRLATGRPGFIDEVMRFLDLHLKGIQPEVVEPKVVVQDNRGMYRAETAWPPEDMSLYWSDLNTGAYGDGTGGGDLWSFTPPLEHDVWLAGEPVVKLELDTTLPRANVVADVFDVAPDGDADLINRGTYLVQGRGEQFVTFDLYGQDWRVPAGHRIGVVLSGQDLHNGGFWLNVPSGQDVEVVNARIGLPFLYWEREPEEYLDGGSSPRLEQHLASGIDVSSDTITAGQRAFDLPGPLVERPDEEETQVAA
jgi:hypothetical protein